MEPNQDIIDITINLAKEKKRIMEGEISDLIVRFMKETGLKVSSINLHIAELGSGFPALVTTHAEVTLR